MGGAGDGAPSWRFHGRGRAGRVLGPLPHVGVDQPGFRPARATLPMASTVRALAIVFAISQNQAVSPGEQRRALPESGAQQLWRTPPVAVEDSACHFSLSLGAHHGGGHHCPRRAHA